MALSELHIKYYRRFKAITARESDTVPQASPVVTHERSSERKLTPPRDPNQVLRLRKTRHIFSSRERVKYDYERRKYKIISSPTMAGLANCRRDARGSDGSVFSEDEEILDRSFDTLLKRGQPPRRPELDAVRQDLDQQRFSAKKLAECARELAADQQLRRSMDQQEIVAACHLSNKKAHHPFATTDFIASPQTAHGQQFSPQSPKFQAVVRGYSPLLTTLPEEDRSQIYTPHSQDPMEHPQPSLSFREPRPALSPLANTSYVTSEPHTTKHAAPTRALSTSLAMSRSASDLRVYRSSYSSYKRPSRKLSRRQCRAMVQRLHEGRSSASRHDCRSCTLSVTSQPRATSTTTIMKKKRNNRTAKKPPPATSRFAREHQLPPTAPSESAIFSPKSQCSFQSFPKKKPPAVATPSAKDRVIVKVVHGADPKPCREARQQWEARLEQNSKDLLQMRRNYDKKLTHLTEMSQTSKCSLQQEMSQLQSYVSELSMSVEQRARQAAEEISEGRFQKLYQQEHAQKEEITKEFRSLKTQMEQLQAENARMARQLRKQSISKENQRPPSEGASKGTGASSSGAGGLGARRDTFHFSQKVSPLNQKQLKDIETKASRDMRNSSLSLTLSQIEQEGGGSLHSTKAQRVGKIFFS